MDRRRPAMTTRDSGSTTSTAPKAPRRSMPTANRELVKGCRRSGALAAARALRDTFDAFVGEFEQFDHHFMSLCVQRAGGVARRPCLADDEARPVLARFVLDDDRDAPAIAGKLALRHVTKPVEQCQRIPAGREAVLQRDVAVLREARELSHVRRIGALAVVDDGDLRFEPGDL